MIYSVNKSVIGKIEICYVLSVSADRSLWNIIGVTMLAQLFIWGSSGLFSITSIPLTTFSKLNSS